MNRLTLAARIAQNDFDITTELPENLATSAAGRREIVGVGGDGDAPKLSSTLGNGLENRDPFRAQRKSVTGVFHIAAGVDAAGFILKRGTDAEFRERRMGMLARGEGGGE